MKHLNSSASKEGLDHLLSTKHYQHFKYTTNKVYIIIVILQRRKEAMRG